MNTPLESRKPARNGLLDEIENIILHGYGKKEERRALDKSLRDKYYVELTTLRHQWEKIYLEVIRTGQVAIGSQCKGILLTLDRVSSSINRTEYGYAPLFDRVQKIQNDTLNNLLRYDINIATSLTKLNADIKSVEGFLKAASWDKVEALVGIVNEDIKDLEIAWRNRKKVFDENLE